MTDPSPHETRTPVAMLGARIDQFRPAPGESRTTLDAIAMGLVADWQPVDQTERLIVARMAMAGVREARADMMEADALRRHEPPQVIGQIDRYRQNAETAFRRALEDLLRYRKARKDGLVAGGDTGPVLAPDADGPAGTDVAAFAQAHGLAQAGRACGSAPARCSEAANDNEPLTDIDVSSVRAACALEDEASPWDAQPVQATDAGASAGLEDDGEEALFLLPGLEALSEEDRELFIAYQNVSMKGRFAALDWYDALPIDRQERLSALYRIVEAAAKGR